MTRIDRRALFTSGAAAALLAATGTSLAAAPRAGGVLRLAVPRQDGLMEQVARGAVYDTLTEIAADGVLRAELAKDWHSSDDARIWRFNLRQDVLFHDGPPLTAADVVASLERSGIAGADVVSVRQSGVMQVEIGLKRANPHVPFLLADPALSITRLGQTHTSLAQAVGTGCYRVERAQDDRHFRAARVADHYKAGQVGWVDAVEVIVIPDARVRAEALRDGYVDVAALPAPEELIEKGGFLYHPSASDMALAARSDVGIPRTVGRRTALDDGRIAERWWRI